METRDGTAQEQVRETLWLCRAYGCGFVGTSDETLDHVQETGHQAFDRVDP
jgi:hypothetical protein